VHAEVCSSPRRDWQRPAKHEARPSVMRAAAPQTAAVSGLGAGISGCTKLQQRSTSCAASTCRHDYERSRLLRQAYTQSGCGSIVAGGLTEMCQIGWQGQDAPVACSMLRLRMFRRCAHRAPQPQRAGAAVAACWSRQHQLRHRPPLRVRLGASFPRGEAGCCRRSLDCSAAGPHALQGTHHDSTRRVTSCGMIRAEHMSL
jgi:hypothetical protein